MKLRADRLAERRSEALTRKAEWASLTPQQQIASLDARLGEGNGAKRQRRLIAARISKESAK